MAVVRRFCTKYINVPRKVQWPTASVSVERGPGHVHTFYTQWPKLKVGVEGSEEDSKDSENADCLRLGPAASTVSPVAADDAAAVRAGVDGLVVLVLADRIHRAVPIDPWRAAHR